MTRLQMQAGVVPAEGSELVRYPDDEIWLRVVDKGEVQVIEYFSTDREGSPAHSHPWDEIEIVVDGEAEFMVGGVWSTGGPGTVQLLPQGEPHAVRIPHARARILMITVGAAYDGFARDMARLFAEGAPLAAVVEAAARHGVQVA